MAINAALARLACAPRDEVVVEQLLALGRHTFVFGVGEVVGGGLLGCVGWGYGDGEEKWEDDMEKGDKGGKEEATIARGEWVVILVVGVLFVGWAGTVCGVVGVVGVWVMRGGGVGE